MVSRMSACTRGHLLAVLRLVLGRHESDGLLLAGDRIGVADASDSASRAVRENSARLKHRLEAMARQVVAKAGILARKGPLQLSCAVKYQFPTTISTLCGIKGTNMQKTLCGMGILR